MSKFLELAKKVAALAKFGSPGEKEAAQQKMEVLMKKHGFSSEDLEEEKRSFFDVELPKDRFKLMLQVAVSIDKDLINYGFHYGHVPGIAIFRMQTTRALAIEIEIKFDFYLDAFEKDLDAFFMAFVHKNQLYRQEAPASDTEKLTKEEKEQRRKALKIMTGLNAHEFLNKLPS